jgi:hypothetical protein
MIPRSAAVIILLSPLAAACGTLGYPVSIETPITATLDVSAFQRVFVAGFSCSGGEDEIDLNDEMVRVLRTELRNKSMLHVIESAPLRPPSNTGWEGPYWRRVGEEFDGALLITGTARFEVTHRLHSLSPTPPTRDLRGSLLHLTPQHDFEAPGFALEFMPVFIDGRTGERLYAVTLHNQVVYDTTGLVPALSGYFDLMNRMLPAFVRIVSDQKLRGERLLLK